MRRHLAATALVFALVLPVWGQGEPEERPEEGQGKPKPEAQPKLEFDPKGRPEASLSDLHRQAVGLRRSGKLAAAGLALDEILRRLAPNSTHRQAIALELAQVYVVMGRHYSAVVVYRKIQDVPREIETLLEMGKERFAREALAVSRHVKYPLGEARALLKLGKQEEALGVLTKAGQPLAKERGKLLLQLQRHPDAAAAFAEASDFLGQAEAVKVTDQRQAKRLYEDAGEQLKLRLKLELIPQAKGAKERAEQAQDAVTLERARIYYAQTLGQMGQAYRDWARCFAGTNEADKAVRSAQKALGFLNSQKERLEDGGRDAFGQKAAEALGVNRAIAEVQAELGRYQAQLERGRPKNR